MSQQICQLLYRRSKYFLPTVILMLNQEENDLVKYYICYLYTILRIWFHILTGFFNWFSRILGYPYPFLLPLGYLLLISEAFWILNIVRSLHADMFRYSHAFFYQAPTEKCEPSCILSKFCLGHYSACRYPNHSYRIL